MSHRIGIAHFPVLHRQFSKRGSEESSPVPDVTQDNKDVLIERLNDLVSLLSKDIDLEDQTVTGIHQEVDKIESLIRGKEMSPKPRHTPRELKKPIELSSPRVHEDIFWGPPTPTRTLTMRFPDMSKSPVHASPSNIQHCASPSQTIEVANVAEELANNLSKIITELRTRRDESDHIHDILVEKAEAAANRILFLENCLTDIEEECDASQSELNFLRIQLQAIETQSYQYIPRNEDIELTQSIKNWKGDWEKISKTSKERRKTRQSLTTSTFDSTHTSIEMGQI